MPICDVPPPDKSKLGKAVGHDLLERHGKREYYTREQITDSCERLGYPIDWSCWAMSLFLSPPSFTNYHESIGEVCDLATMKSEMVAAVTEEHRPRGSTLIYPGWNGLTSTFQTSSIGSTGHNR